MRRSVLEREKDSVASLVHATQELQNTSTSGTRLPQGAKWELPPEVGAREQFPSAHVQVFALVLLYSILWGGECTIPVGAKRPPSRPRRGSARGQPQVVVMVDTSGALRLALGRPDGTTDGCGLATILTLP